MDNLSAVDVRQLAEHTGHWCASIYLPTHRSARETQPDRIRLRGAITQVEQQLVSAGLRAPVARDMLQPAQQLLLDDPFWKYQSDGLAVFVAPELFRTFRLPCAFDELTMVNDHFHLKPMLPMLQGDGTFYVLALSQKQVRVLQGDKQELRELHPSNVPNGLAEVLRFDVMEKSLQHHSGSAGRDGNPIYHGQGAGKDVAKNHLLRYFQQIDRGLHELLRKEDAPLVLAGVDYYLPIYREANSYAHLLETTVSGSPNQWSEQELHSKAWEIVEPHFHAAQDKAAAQYRQQVGTGRASGDVREVALSAGQGRVAKMFVALNGRQWGTVDLTANSVEELAEEKPGTRDLLDYAAVHTFLNHGSVYVVQKEQMPSESSVAAIYRY